MTDTIDQDIAFYSILASNMPISGSVARESRWESGMQHSLSVHMCHTDEDGNAIDDHRISMEFHALDDSSEYEELDESVGGPIRTEEQREQLRIWNKILASHGLSMRAGRMRHDRVKGPDVTEPERVEDFAPLIEAALSGAPVASASVRVSMSRLKSLIEVDRVCQHVVGTVVNTGPGPDFIRTRITRLPRHRVVNTW